MQNTQHGDIVLQTWLTENNISHSLAQRYVTSGWLKKLRAGVFYRATADEKIMPSWDSALQAMTDQLSFSVHLAGLSSLAQQGLSHYLQLREEQIWLGVPKKVVLPRWFAEYPDQNWLVCRNSKLSSVTKTDYKTVLVNGRELKASSPELAAYEVVESIGKHIRFQHAAELFQGLTNLSPRKVQSILERSGAIQTNRVFLYLSHYYAHQWVKRLDESKIKLGTGKRQVVENGRYEDSYQITVPNSFVLQG